MSENTTTTEKHLNKHNYILLHHQIKIRLALASGSVRTETLKSCGRVADKAEHTLMQKRYPVVHLCCVPMSSTQRHVAEWGLGK